MLLTWLSVGLLLLGSARGHQSGHHGSPHDQYPHVRPVASKGSKFKDGVVFDREHILEDVKDTYGVGMDRKQVSDQEVAFYYFETHDFDKNNKLDGLEMLTAMNHIFDDPEAPPEGSTTTALPDPEKDGPIEEFYRLRNQKKWGDKFDLDSEFIDEMVMIYDLDKDGFLSYPEYIIASQANA